MKIKYVYVPIQKNLEPWEARICDLAPGTSVTNVKGKPSFTYVKLNKEEIGSGVTLSWPNRSCILIDISRGSLRAICATDIVSVTDGDLELRMVNAKNYLKQ